MKFTTICLLVVSMFLSGCSEHSSAIPEIYYIDEENGVKASLSEAARKASSFMLCATYFNDKGQSMHSKKSMDLFQSMASIGNETWSKTVFVKSVADTSKSQLDKNTKEEVGIWCETNITPMVVKSSEYEAEEYNRRSEYFSFPLRCAQIAMYAFNKPDNKVIAGMHLKYVEQKYSWTMDDLNEADIYIKKQFQEKRKRYPAQMSESDLLQMMYASDFSCNDHK